MKKTAVFLADGFEEVEAMAPVDICRRAGIEVMTVSIKDGDRQVKASHGVSVTADAAFDEAFEMSRGFSDVDMLILPGGGVGTKNLKAHEGLRELLVEADSQGKRLSAICAAPSVLGELGLLEGRKACCYPGFEDSLKGAQVIKDGRVCVDGRFITARGMGVSIDFGLAIVKELAGEEAARKVAESIQFA